MNEEIYTLEDIYKSLPSYQASTVKRLVEMYGEEKAAEYWLDSLGPKQTSHFGGNGTALVSQSPSYWQRCKTELDKLICGHPSWEDEHKKYITVGKAITIGTAAAIAAAIAPVIGISTIVITPAVELLLHSISKVGFRAYCANKSFE